MGSLQAFASARLLVTIGGVNTSSAVWDIGMDWKLAVV
jgi:hypothetical protein